MNTARYDQSCHTTAFFVEFNINDTADLFPAADVDHIFFFQFTETHEHSPSNIGYAEKDGCAHKFLILLNEIMLFMFVLN